MVKCKSCEIDVLRVVDNPYLHIDALVPGSLVERPEGLAFEFKCECGHDGKILLLVHIAR